MYSLRAVGLLDFFEMGRPGNRLKLCSDPAQRNSFYLEGMEHVSPVRDGLADALAILLRFCGRSHKIL